VRYRAVCEYAAQATCMYEKKIEYTCVYIWICQINLQEHAQVMKDHVTYVSMEGKAEQTNRGWNNLLLQYIFTTYDFAFKLFDQAFNFLNHKKSTEQAKVKIYIFIYSKNVYSTTIVWQKPHQATENKGWQFLYLRSIEPSERIWQVIMTYI
jgi:hypothetical protein